MKDSRLKKGEEPEQFWNWEVALKSAILCGLSIEQFEYMTPYEVSLFIEATLERQENERKEQLSLVWLGEYYHRTKRLPKLQDELKKVSSEYKEPMSTEEMLKTVKALNTQFGGITIKGGE